MVRQTTRRHANTEDAEGGMSLWAGKLIDSFERYSQSMERSISQTFDGVFSQISDLKETQSMILAKLTTLESRISVVNTSTTAQQNLLYSTMVKIRADSQKIDDKLKTITWVGIDEKGDEK
ncbi:hypothetical protein Y032_0015g2683 [Ancylostoma ceylanicum]|uniref:Uncharacterized protein n=1 Tax=Ancylostoma ceylanicum TaxID=53326 RepID=A0A016V9V8_9BILA|nr:hypothetical protein Y032_0015g2683 [Ancylostoma ceylanicum]